MFERQSERLPADLFGRDDFGAEIGPEQEITFVAQYGFNPNSVEYQAATMTPGLGGLYLGVVINITRIDAFDQRETRDYGFSTQLNVYTHGVDVRLTATSPEVFRTQEQARAAAETI